MFCVGVLFIYVAGLFFAACAPQIVSWHASRFRRTYSDPKKLEQVEKLMVFDPVDRFMVGTMSRYITLGPEHPEAFPRMIWSFRLVGLVLIIVPTLVMIWVSLEGRPP